MALVNYRDLQNDIPTRVVLRPFGSIDCIYLPSIKYSYLLITYYLAYLFT